MNEFWGKIWFGVVKNNVLDEAEFQISRENVHTIIFNWLMLKKKLIEMDAPWIDWKSQELSMLAYASKINKNLKAKNKFFFKTTWLFKGSYFEQRVTIDNKTFKSNFLFSLVAAQNKQKPT